MVAYIMYQLHFYFRNLSAIVDDTIDKGKETAIMLHKMNIDRDGTLLEYRWSMFQLTNPNESRPPTPSPTHAVDQDTWNDFLARCTLKKETQLTWKVLLARLRVKLIA